MRASMIIHPDELSREWIDKLSDAGIEVLGIHPVGGEHAVESLGSLLRLCKTREYREMIDYALGRGLKIEYELHAAGYLLPRELFSVHPEYFRMNEMGERTPDHNLCASDPEALGIFSARAAELALSLYGSTESFYFWMDDGHGLSCRCEKCKALSPSDQTLIVTNAMLREIKRHIPNARIAYLAYMDSIAVPQSITPERGVFLEYAPFEKYTARGEDAAELIAREREMIKPLMRFFSDEPSKVLEYWYDNSMLSEWKKPPRRFVLDREAMDSDIEEYKGSGFEVISSFACYLGSDYGALHGAVDITPFSEAVKGG